MKDGMRPQTVGRVLGIGLRVAGRLASDRMGGDAKSGAHSVTLAGGGGPGVANPSHRIAGRKAGRTTAGVARGVGGFLRPFGRIGGILMLEVTGVFFLLFAGIFGNWGWKLRASYQHGPDHTRFLTFVAMTALFLYLAVSSFWRARRK